jgi:nitroimidazol reductase NimA-like FMN-containing flavoprotein (pyridoxamine 5'-phosphate oxidase superfamily)
MADISSVEMDDEALAEFLAPGGTGVLSFSTGTDEPPYAIPVSYGYDGTGGRFFFRLAFPDGSGKVDVVESPVTFVTHRQPDGRWRSAIATGTLEEVTDDDYDFTTLAGTWAVELPLVEMFERPTREVTFRYFRLVPDELTGREETTAP